MVCMSLRIPPRIYIQKTNLRKFFRHTNPATQKSYPNVFPRYMRRAARVSKARTAPGTVIAQTRLRVTQNAQCCSSRAGLPWRFGVIPNLPHQASPRGSQLSWLRACGFVTARLVSQVAVGNVNSSRLVYQGIGQFFFYSLGWANAYILKRRLWCCARACEGELKSR